jgi:DNA-binding response OmpR family regulator
MSEKPILIIDDERPIVALVQMYLEQAGYAVTAAYDGLEGLRLARSLHPALIVLDGMLPSLDGFEVCRTLRRESDVPIIMLTARTDDVDRIVGLELGADDYLGKPFNPRELVARVKAILRRAQAAAPATAAPAAPLVLGNTVIDAARHEVSIAGKPVTLRNKEFELLEMFARHLGLVLDRDRLLNEVWGYEYMGDTRTVDVHVAHLRERMAGSSLNIQTIRGAGYKPVLEG